MINLLVFGSLRKTSTKGYNFNRFGFNTQKYIKNVILNGYEMYNLGSYPAICEGDGKIKCELHEVNTTAFQKILIMENGAGYTEKQIKLEDGTVASIFTMEKEKIKNYPRIKSGDWI